MNAEFKRACNKVGDMFFDACDGKKTGPCGVVLPEPTEEQEAIARILYWLRDKKKDKEWCWKRSCRPAPKGFSTKPRGIWMPSPEESCLAPVATHYEITKENGKSGVAVKPYAWWYHCKSYDHCLFLVQARLPFVARLLGEDMVRTTRMAAALMTNNVPVLTADSELLTQDFFKDWCTGIVKEPKCTPMVVEVPVQVSA